MGIRGLRTAKFVILSTVLSVWGSFAYADGIEFLPGVVGAGYGYAHTAFCGGVEALFWNPAGLVGTSRKTYTVSVMQKPEALNFPVGVGQVGIALPKRAQGVWAYGVLSMRGEQQHLLQMVGYARRLHSLVKIGAAAYHDNLSVTRLSKWGLIIGMTIQPAKWLRGSVVLRGRSDKLLGKGAAEDTWNDYSFALSIGDLSPMVFLADADPAIRRAALGIGYKLSSLLVVRAGLSATLSRTEWQAMPRRAQIHFGLSAGHAAKFEYAFVLSSEGVFAHSFGFRLPLGRIVRQITLKPKILTISPSRPVGSFATYEPPLQAEEPNEILSHIDESGLEGLIRTYGRFIRRDYSDPEALKKHNGLAPDVLLSPGTVVRIPLRTSEVDSSSIAEVTVLLDKSLALETAHWPAWQLKGLLSYLAGQSLAAESQLGKARTLNPNSPEVLAVLAQLYVSDGHPEKAVELLEQVATVKGKGARWANLGLALELAGKHREAIRAFRNADSLGYESPSSMFYWGEAYLKLGELKEGKTKLSELIQRYSQTLFALRAAELLRDYSEGATGNEVVALKKAVTCRGLGRHPLRPQGVSTAFPDRGRVYLYVEVSRESRSRIHIQPAWYREGELIFKSDRGWVMGPSNRTYGYKTMHGAADRGQWRVELRVKETGQYLGQVTFTVVPGESGGNRRSKGR